MSFKTRAVNFFYNNINNLIINWGEFAQVDRMPAWGGDKKTKDRQEYSKIDTVYFADDSVICLAEKLWDWQPLRLDSSGKTT